MATYKKPCIHCGELVEGDSYYCPKCSTPSPFAHVCPSCLRPVGRGDAACSGCGRKLMADCPLCGGRTFAGSEVCSVCGGSLMVTCGNERCGKPQFFDNATCTYCGKPIRNTKKPPEGK